MSYLILNAAVSVLALAGFIYGIVISIKKRQPLYVMMIIISVGTTAFTRMYEVIYMWINEEYFSDFHIGIIGTIATFLSILSANFGTIDSLGDDHSKKYRKYRLIALLAPFTFAMFYVPIALSDGTLSLKISYAAIYLVMMASSYYNLKHLIIPDVKFGIIKCLRPYNFLMLCYSLLFAIEQIALINNKDILLIIVTSLIAIDSFFIVPILRRGVSRWTI